MSVIVKFATLHWYLTVIMHTKMQLSLHDSSFYYSHLVTIVASQFAYFETAGCICFFTGFNLL